MADVRPFRAVRYDLIGAGNPLALVAPPYSQLTGDLYDQYSNKSPHNVVHLCPKRVSPDDSGVNRISRQPTAQLSRWLTDGLVRKENVPKYYSYEQTYWGSAGRTTCRGVLGLLNLEPEADKVVLPYSKEHAPSRFGHDQLIRASSANVCPVLALYKDGEGRLDDLLLSEHSPFPDVAITDDFSVEHRLFSLSSQDQISAISRFLSKQEIMIGEGQQTFHAARSYRKTRRLTENPEGPQPYDYVMTLFCSSSQPGLAIRPYHRVFRNLPDFKFAKLVKALNEVFYLNPVRSLRDVDGMVDDLVEAGRDRPAFVIIGGGAVGRRAGYVVSLDSRKAARFLADADVSKARSRLDVTLLEHLVVKGLLGTTVREAEEQGFLTFHTDPHKAAADGRAKDCQLVILLKPPPMEELRAICQADEHIPLHTASFFPQRLSGLIMNDLTEF